MYPNRTRKPAWYKDAKWLCGILLALTIAAGTLLISLAQLTRPELSQRVLTSILSISLLPESFGTEPEPPPVEAEAPADEVGYTLGEPLTLIPGVDAAISAADIETMNAEEARSRIAALLADDIVTGGIPKTLERVSEPTLNAQFSQAVQTTLPPLVTSSLERALLDPPAELGTGTRLNDWRLQAQQNPNRNVQPIVGVFVTAPANVLSSLSSRQIGEYVVAELATTLLNEGLPATQERASREVVKTLVSQTAGDEIRTQSAQLFNALLVPQDVLITERLAEANATIAAQAVPAEAEAAPETLQGLTPASALLGLSPEAASVRIASDIASAVYTSDAATVAQQLSSPVQAAQLLGVAKLVNLLTAEQNQIFLRWTYTAGGIALVLIVAFMYFCVSWERFVGSGLSIMAGAALGSLIFTTASSFENAVGELPAAPPVSGIPSYAADTLRYTFQQLPPGVTELFARNHLIVLATGAGLIGLFLIQQAWNVIRPRRSRF